MCCSVACLLRSLLQQLFVHQTALLQPCIRRCHPLPSTAQEADLQRHKQRLVKEGKLPEEPPPAEGQEQAAAGRQQRAAGGWAVVHAMGGLVGCPSSPAVLLISWPQLSMGSARMLLFSARAASCSLLLLLATHACRPGAAGPGPGVHHQRGTVRGVWDGCLWYAAVCCAGSSRCTILQALGCTCWQQHCSRGGGGGRCRLALLSTRPPSHCPQVLAEVLQQQARLDDPQALRRKEYER